MDPRLLPVFSFNLWRKPQHHNKHKLTFYLFSLTSEQVLPNGFLCVTVHTCMNVSVSAHIVGVIHVFFLNLICISLLQGGVTS